jgi:nucleoside phosphorylase
MLYISTALYCEAQPFIRYYNLKKEVMDHRFQIFKNENVIVIITKTGNVNAAIGVTYLCSGRVPCPSDLFINIGVCAAYKKDIPIGTVFLCNKIIDQVTNRSYYPDVLFRHPFFESAITSSPCMINHVREEKHTTEENQTTEKNQTTEENQTTEDKERQNKYEITKDVLRKEIENFPKENINLVNDTLIDMEAAGIYQAASIFFQSHQLIFIKMISDYGDKDKITPEKVTKLIQNNVEKIVSWLDKINMNFSVNQNIFSAEEEEYIHKIVTNLLCTVSMEYKLRQMLRYYKLSHGSFREIVCRYLKNADMPCKTKIEGKKHFEQLKSELI